MEKERYTVIYEKTVIKKDIPKLDSSARELIQRAIDDRLTTEPLKYGEPLSNNLKGWRRLRVSKYRIIYCVEGRIVKVDAIGIRDKIYK